MIVILKDNPDKEQLDGLMKWLKEQNIDVHPTVGSRQTILGLIGDTSSLDMDLIASLDIVEESSACRSRTKMRTANSTPMTRS